MYIQERSRNPRNLSMMLDAAHIIIGILIVVLAVISFLNPEDHMLLFPVIFLLAASLNIMNAVFKIRMSGREKKKKASGILVLPFGIVLLALAVISAVSIWWG